MHGHSRRRCLRKRRAAAERVPRHRQVRTRHGQVPLQGCPHISPECMIPQSVHVYMDTTTRSDTAILMGGALFALVSGRRLSYTLSLHLRRQDPSPHGLPRCPCDALDASRPSPEAQLVVRVTLSLQHSVAPLLEIQCPQISVRGTHAYEAVPVQEPKNHIREWPCPYADVSFNLGGHHECVWRCAGGRNCCGAMRWR